MSNGASIGLISVTRKEPGEFAAHHVQLLQTFADQAVIAIENVRLFNETREALERQTATADILKVIASSPSDVQPVFEAIVANADRLIGGFSTGVYRFVGGICHLEAFTPVNPAADEMLRARFPRPVAGIRHFELAHAGETVEITDTETQAADLPLREIARARGFRSVLYSPLISKGTAIGVIVVSRRNPGSFSAHHVELLRTFADQAVIAIENARLFNETQEALERQTATADILKVIASSPSDVQPVFEAIARRANTLIGGFSSTVFRFIDGIAHLKAFTPTTPAADEILQATFPRPVADFPPFRMAQAGEVTQIPDTEALSDEILDISRARGFRSMLFAPLMNDGTSIGFIAVTRVQPGAFADHHVQLLRTFADQAVIAIENARLFNEVQAKTRDLTEALTYQTGSSKILGVIASSPTDVAPVLKAIVESACELCEAYDAVVLLRDGDHLRFSAHHGPIGVNLEKWPINRNWTAGRALVDRKPVHVRDMLSDEGAEFPDSRELSRHTDSPGIRSILSVPLLRENESIGTILLRRTEVHPFSEKQIALLQTFADQAVIAIGNVRLFDEVQARTQELSESLEQQTATSEVLSVISRSAGDLAPVFDAMLSKAMQLCGADFGVLNTFDGELFHTAATRGLPPAYDEYRRSQPLEYGPGTAPARLLQGEPIVEIADLVGSDAYRNGEPNRRALVDVGGARCLLAVPLLKDERVVGNVMIFRQDKRRFSEKQIALLKQFAAQAVIAIENTRLLRELRASTEDLRKSLQQQTATADVLKVISRSAFDLQTVLETLVRSAAELSGSKRGVIFLRDGDLFRFRAMSYADANPEWIQYLKDHPQKAGQNSAIARAISSGQIVYVPDVLADPQIDMPATALAGIRAVLAVPLLRDGKVEGIMALSRSTPGTFDARQIDLVQTFADQALIAIENVRLFDEVQARTRELAASLEELRTAQDRLVQTEKLASLGQLTAGIAHEIKNPLNFVNNFSALSAELTDELNDVLKSAPLGDKTREEVDDLTRTLKDNLERVVQHGKRADSIVKNMLLHSREGSGDHRPADINALLDESLNLAYHGARAERREFNVTLQRDFDEMAGMIEVFPQEITRVLLNLISNGFYAVTKRRTENGGLGFEPILRASTRDLGDTVEIRIRDNGTGIPAEVKEKMFNPFFTTKPAGEGTGLGLSMSHDIIVKQHGGRIEVETEPGEFTEFTIVLPRASNFSNKIRGRT